MKKSAVFLFLACLWGDDALADTVVYIDGNGNVTRQVFTAPSTFDTPSQTTTTTTTTTMTAETAPTVTVVRDAPIVHNSYYYDSYPTGAAVAAGVTTAVVGGLLYDGFWRHHHRRWHRPPCPRHWGHRHWGHGYWRH